MAAVEVTISGVLYDKYARTTRPVVLIGEASLTGLGIGGGPIIPDQPPSQPGDPPHIWGPPGPWPTPPIYWPGFPSLPGGSPPGIWGPTDPRPTPPIVIPDPIPPNLPPMTDLPVGSTLIITKTADGPKWAYVPPPPGGIGPPGNLPPFPHPAPVAAPKK